MRRRLKLTVEIVSTYRKARSLMRSTDLSTALRTLRHDDPGHWDHARDEHAPWQQRLAGKRIGNAVMRVLRVLPVDRRCLIRSLVVSALIARRGIPGVLVLGVRPNSDEPFLAHAWVEVYGGPVIPHESFKRLHEL